MSESLSCGGLPRFALLEPPAPPVRSPFDLQPPAGPPPWPSRGPKLVGLMGYAGAGKSSVAAILARSHGYQTPHIGAPMKAMLRTLLREMDYTAEMAARIIDGDLKREIIPELGVTATQAQQTLGTEWGRDCIGPSFWLDLWLAKADRIIAAGGRVAQESVRFPNEAAAIRARGGVLYEVRRPGVGPLPGGHVSEKLPAEPDGIILNDSTLAELTWTVASIAEG